MWIPLGAGWENETKKGKIRSMTLTRGKDDFKNLLMNQLMAQGFSRARILSPLPTFQSEELPSGGHCDPDIPVEARSVMLVFFPYYRGDSISDNPASSMARLAPFARRNNYKEAVTRLKYISSWIRQETGMTKNQSRIFCNSHFAEKQMAWRCGLGYLGKNSLILTPEYGSLGIIAGIFLPFDLPGDNPLESKPYENCGQCQRCSAACPGGALKGEGGIEKNLCYQQLSTVAELLSEQVMETWGSILYGCQICQDVCPYNRHKPDGIISDLGALGAGLDPVTLLSLSDGEMKSLLKGSVPGASWIQPVCLRRNALLCLPRDGDAKAQSKEILEKYAASDDSILAGTAIFLREKYFS